MVVPLSWRVMLYTIDYTHLSSVCTFKSFLSPFPTPLLPLNFVSPLKGVVSPNPPFRGSPYALRPSFYSLL